MLDDIGEVCPEHFDALDTSAGAWGCYARLRLRQSDGRWRARYLKATADGVLRAAVPVYAQRGKTWLDPAYDITSWPLPERLIERCLPTSCLLVGNCSGARASLHVDPAVADGPELRRLVVELACLAADENRCLVFPYLGSESKAALAKATDDAITWTTLRREAQLDGVDDARWERAHGSRVYGVLRRDQRLIAAAGLKRSTRSWPEVADEASELIAAHNQKKGEFDHPEFVRLRYAEWQQCQGVEVVVFTAAADDVDGVLTALVWGNELELCEIGLTGDEGPDRLAAYLDLLFHHPVGFARSRHLRKIRAGYGAEVPKKSRGAVFEVIHGGVLDHAHTRRLAGDTT